MAVTCIPFRFPGLRGVRCAFQTRVGGASRDAWGGGNISFAVGDDGASVAANRRDLRETLGVRALAELRQVHGDTLIFDPLPVAPEASPCVDGDGMATARPGMGLMIKTADCQPILLAHVEGRHIAALHAGWRGNRMDFPGSGVARFCEYYGLHPRDVLAVRGPSLGPARAEFVNFAAEWGEAFSPWFDARERTMDLWSLTRHQLLRAGLLPAHIFGLDLCTASLPELFYSYRREKVSGRQAGVIWIEEER
ncbi:MAG: polyphenol oxidase family protein [Desulfovibrionaceae bacterium]|nr:polyphenol oxidase family protein [Desulfovibrionaceae bacterium]